MNFTGSKTKIPTNIKKIIFVKLQSRISAKQITVQSNLCGFMRTGYNLNQL
jgi:hypothetical protein